MLCECLKLEICPWGQLTSRGEKCYVENRSLKLHFMPCELCTAKPFKNTFLLAGVFVQWQFPLQTQISWHARFSSMNATALGCVYILLKCGSWNRCDNFHLNPGFLPSDATAVNFSRTNHVSHEEGERGETETDTQFWNSEIPRHISGDLNPVPMVNFAERERKGW